MDAKQVVEMACEPFNAGFNCAESVLMSLAKALDLDCACIPRIATAFGAGVARHGEMCGALTGALMGLGLKHGRETVDNERKNALYAKADLLLRAFSDEFGSTGCLDLTDCDLQTEEGARAFADADLHHTLCPKFVAFAAERAFELLQD